MQIAYVVQGELINHTTIKLKEPLPFNDGDLKIFIEVREIQKKSRKELCGLLKGKISLSPDFNEPLEDFKEYMQ